MITGTKRNNSTVSKKSTNEPQKKIFKSKKKEFKKDANKKVIKDGNKTPGEKLPKDTAATRKERKLIRWPDVCDLNHILVPELYEINSMKTYLRAIHSNVKKQQKPTYELSHKALKLWEKLRIAKSTLSKKDKHELVAQLLKLLQENEQKLSKLAYAHDTSRVIQSCLKDGNKEQRTEIYNGMKDEILELSKDKYAKNIVWKLVLYGTPEQRKEIMYKFDDVPKLIRKPLPASIIEYAYNTFANEEQRKFLVTQLYGNMYNITKTKSISTIADVIKQFPDKKEAVLSSFRENLRVLIDKEVMKHTIVHNAFYEFFKHCDIPKMRSEMIESLRESLIHVVHTHDGAHVTMHCLWHGNSKDRKIIVKTFKEFIEKLCSEEFGHLPLLAAFDVVDDTVFMKKAIVQPIIKLLPDLIQNKIGRKVLAYLISPRNSSFFLPETVKVLSTGDNNLHSKKNQETRQQEIREAASPGIIEFVSKNISMLATDNNKFSIIELAITKCTGDVSSVVNALINLVKKDFYLNENHLIESASGHLLMKRLVSPKHPEAHKDSPNIGQAILDGVSEQNLIAWTSCNRGGFILLSMLENKNISISSATKKLLLKNLDVLKSVDNVKSAQVLVSKLTK